MKAYFIYRDGKSYGSPVGYTTEKGAKKSLVGSEDWHRELHKYDLGYAVENPPQESIDLGIYVWYQPNNYYVFKREVWSRKIWQKYLKEHYEIKEQEFEINVNK